MTCSSGMARQGSLSVSGSGEPAVRAYRPLTMIPRIRVGAARAGRPPGTAAGAWDRGLAQAPAPRALPRLNRMRHPPY